MAPWAPVWAQRSESHDRALDAALAVESYLESRGLSALLIEHLWSRLPTAAAGEKLEIAERLGALYSERLETVRDAAEARAIEQKCRELLAAAPDAESYDLRLTLHRAAFNRAERLMEQWRLRLVEAEQREDALRSLRDLSVDLAAIGAQAHRRVQEFERQEESGRDLDMDLIARHLADARRHRSLAMYLAGWADAIVAEATNNGALASEALKSFGWLLNAPPGKHAEIERAPAQLFNFEHVARAAVGAAVCEAVRSNFDVSVQWLDLVEDAENVPEAVLSETPARRMTILARAGRWYDLTRVVESRRSESGGTLNPGEARLLAALALEAPASPPAPQETATAARMLTQTALSDLVARGELGQVLDLSRRYGTAPLGADGFIGRHVRGLRAYEESREAHRASRLDADAPAPDGDLAEGYRAAAALLDAALRADDAAEFPEAVATTSLLRALAIFYGAGSGGEAAARLDEAAELLAGAAGAIADADRAAEALALAVRALDLAIDRTGAGATARTERRQALIARFLEEHPDHERAGLMLFKQATAGDLPPDEAVALLLRVSQGSPAHEPARRQAANLLYDLRGRASAEQRDWAALRFADVAEPLLSLDVRRASAGDCAAAERGVALGRRLAEALLSVAAPDAARGERVLDAIEAVMASCDLDSAKFGEEVAFRRAQIALARGDLAAADRALERMRALGSGGGAEGESSEASRAANRLYFRHAAVHWRDARKRGAPAEELAERAQAVVRAGAQVLRDIESAPGGLVDPATLSLYAAMGEAAADLWHAQGDEAARDLAIRMLERVLAAEPGSAAHLRLLAGLAAEAGDAEKAVECWRRLGAGLPSGSPEWFEARCELIAGLARIDPARAREVLNQHKTLHPDLGPAPWGERLRELDASLPRAKGAGAP